MRGGEGQEPPPQAPRPSFSSPQPGCCGSEQRQNSSVRVVVLYRGAVGPAEGRGLREKGSTVSPLSCLPPLSRASLPAPFAVQVQRLEQRLLPVHRGGREWWVGFGYELQQQRQL